MQLPRRSQASGPKKPIFCQVCDKQGFASLFQMVQHTMLHHLHHEEITQTAGYESYKSTRPAMNDHAEESDLESVATKGERLQCDFCNELTRDEAEMMTHLYEVHNDDVRDRLAAAKMIETCHEESREKQEDEDKVEMYSCNLCTKYFPSKATLAQHVGQQHEKQLLKNFECEQCAKSFGKAASLKQHIRRAHNKPKKQEQQLKAPVLDKKPFKCSVCDKAFATSRGENNHKKRSH